MDWLYWDSGLSVIYADNGQAEKLDPQQTEGGHVSQTALQTGEYIHSYIVWYSLSEVWWS